MRGAEKGRIVQLGFDSLTPVSSSDGSAAPPGKLDGVSTGSRVEAARYARHRRGTAKKPATLPVSVKQATLEELFTQPLDATETPVRRTNHERRQPTIAKVEQATQLDLFSLAAVSPEDVRAVSEREPVGRGNREDGAADERAPLPVSDSRQDGLSSGLGDSERPVPFARGRRVIFPEPEEAIQPSRDFRITEEHGVGAGSLHEKARANIAVIILLKTLEAEKREASEPEKAVLVRYSGWGALSQVFEPEWRVRGEWKAIATDLRHIVTEDEYASARATTPNAHFTSPLVINAIWAGLQQLGVSSSVEVLEPAMGVGHFFGLMPEEFQGGHRTGVEIDSLTGRIAQKLYPDTTIFTQGFEDTQLPDNYFDAVVGNVPFGDYPVHDPAMKKGLTRAIHDYFFAKSLEKVRLGGILALITSRYTMDKQDETIRSYLAEKADLIAAVRLPNTAFKDNAGTEVTTDILFLQKRQEGGEARGERWTGTKIVSVQDGRVPLNEYYIHHPEMMLGELSLEGTMYAGRELTLSGELTKDRLQEAIDALPQGIYLPRELRRETRLAPLRESEELKGIKDGGYGEVKGELVIRDGNRLEPVHLSAMEAMRMRGLLRIRDSVRQVFATQLEDAGEERIREARQHLNSIYDQFVRRFGYISTPENYTVFHEDPDHPLLLSLENYDQVGRSASKTAIFEP